MSTPCRVCGEPITPQARIDAGFNYCRAAYCGRWAREPLLLAEVSTGKTSPQIVQLRHIREDAAAGKTRDARRVL